MPFIPEAALKDRIEQLERVSWDKIKVYVGIRINKYTTSECRCGGTLKVGHKMIPLPPKNFMRNRVDNYPIILYGQYQGILEGKGIVKLEMKLGDEKPRKLKKKIWVSIPDKEGSQN